MPRALAVIVLLALLTGCSDPPPGGPIALTPSATPVFASDEEALAAAEVAYGAYLEGLDSALGSYDTTQLSAVATGTALQNATSAVGEFQSDGRKLVGASTFDRASLVARVGDIQIYACLDVSQTDVLGPDGVSTVKPDGLSVYPFVINFAVVEGELRVSDDQVWDGVNFCA